ncbi:MAG: DUF5132 domain-containing protein [Pseudonocardiaceae bacterium]
MWLPFLIGVVTAPLVGKIVKPLVRGTVKATVGAGLQIKKLAAEAAEDVQDLAAEASAQFAAAEVAEKQAELSATAPKITARPAVTTPKKI